MSTDNSRIRATRSLAATLLALVFAADARADKLYWTDYSTEKIERVNPDGTGRNAVITTGVVDLGDLAVDPSGGKIYWADWGTGKVQRANLDGTGVQDLITGLTDPDGIALDLTAGKMYFTDPGDGTIRSANLDGTGMQTIYTDLVYRPYRIALDVPSGQMYWTSNTASVLFTIGKVQRATLAGGSVADIVPVGSYLRDLALDLVNNKIYWSNSGDNRIQQANLDGTGAVNIKTGVQNVNGLAVDPIGSRLFYSDYFTDTIHRTNLDGSGDVTIVNTGLIATNGLDYVVPEPATLGLAVIGGIAMLGLVGRSRRDRAATVRAAARRAG